MRANILILFNWQILQKSAWDMLEKIQDWNTPPVSLFYLSEKSTKFLIFICGGEKKINWIDLTNRLWHDFTVQAMSVEPIHLCL
jgi:hypothetical protein